MGNIEPGNTCFHKATGKKCVVIKNNEDGTIKVRTAEDEERDYHPQELEEPQAGIVKRKKRFLY